MYKLQLPLKGKKRMGSRLVYLDFTLIFSKDHGQGHAHFLTVNIFKTVIDMVKSIISIK